MSDDGLIDRLDACLPQTQCRQCGYAGCRPYATAIAHGEADFNQCPPGGASGIAQLAEVLQRPIKPLNTSHGITKPRQVALIDETRCIGCTLCIQACPVDAIIGAAKRMHTVLQAECTGCELCLPPCPVDCISLIPGLHPPPADHARQRHQFHLFRLERDSQERSARLAAQAQAARVALEQSSQTTSPQALVAAALARAQARQLSSSTPHESALDDE